MIVDNAVYHHGARVPMDCAPSDLATVRAGLAEEGDFVWVGLHEPTETELAAVEEAFGLHPLAVEDALKAHQRPKLEHYDETIFLVLKTLWYVEELDAVETGEINVFVGRDFVVTVRHGAGAELHSARLRLETPRSGGSADGADGLSDVLAHGPSAVVYAVCDTVVDGYAEVTEALTVDVDEVETSVFSQARTNDSVRIYTLKREIAEVRRAVGPLREPMNRFAGGGVPGVPRDSAPFFRDVADHVARIWETVDSLDSLLSTAFDAHLAGVSVRQNEDMRKISAGVGLVAAPTLVAAIYGMNFDHMPELHWTLGYPMALTLMVLTSTAVWIFFKRSGWL